MYFSWINLCFKYSIRFVWLTLKLCQFQLVTLNLDSNQCLTRFGGSQREYFMKVLVGWIFKKETYLKVLLKLNNNNIQNYILT